tara:strand:- start:21 stop:230 length:210 start_codon:yes stop_codon:yes gene_type:complete
MLRVTVCWLCYGIFLLCLNSFGVFILLVVAPALLLGALNVDYDIQNTKQHAIVGLVGLVVLGFWGFGKL